MIYKNIYDNYKIDYNFDEEIKDIESSLHEEFFFFF